MQSLWKPISKRLIENIKEFWSFKRELRALIGGMCTLEDGCISPPKSPKPIFPFKGLAVFWADSSNTS